MSRHDDPLARLAALDPVDERALAAAARDTRGAADLRAILAGGPAPAPPGRRRARAGLRPAVAAAGLAGAAGLVAVLFVAAPGERPPGEPAAAIPPGGWGQEATVRVVPDAGGRSPADAAERAAQIVRARAAALGYAGVEATADGAGTLRVVLPWAILPGDVTALTTPTRVAVYDLPRSRLADSLRPPAALRALRAAPGATADGGWYALSGGRAPRLVAGPLPAPAGGDRGLNWVRAAAGVRAAAVVPAAAPGATSGRGGDPTATWVVLRDPPLVGPDDVVAVVPGRRGTLVVRTAGATPLAGARRLLVTGVGGGVPLAVTARGAGDGTVRTTPGAALDARSAVRWLAGGGLAADLVVVSTRALGTPPPRRGDRVAPPALVRRVLGDSFTSSFAPEAGPTVPATTLRVIRDGPVAVWEARTANGWTVVAAGPQRGGGYAITTNCVLGPSARVIRLCMRGADEAWGRVAPGVARVVVRRAGVRPREATVRNGWFLARVAGPGGATLQAVDASGRVLRAVRY